jgi:D-sedoheptulose 7-phosphate isomerase
VTVTAQVEAIFEARTAPLAALADDAGAVARACHAIAAAFQRGGKLIVFGNGGPSTDAQHVAVEFVHPVIVGKRALPAVSLTADVATVTGIAAREGIDEVFAHQLRVLGEPGDIALGISSDGRCANVRRGLAVARERGLLTVALSGGAPMEADHALVARSDDPQVVKEVHVTTYHVLWELTHVLLERPGVLV